MSSPLLTNMWMATNATFSFPTDRSPDADRRLSKLRRRWDHAVSAMVSSNRQRATVGDVGVVEEMDVSVAWFDRLVAAHTDPSRAYHTLVHLEEMFGYLDAALPSLTEKRPDESCSGEAEAIASMATFFHDAVYDVRSGRNEEDSADLFQKFAAEIRTEDAAATRDGGGSAAAAGDPRLTDFDCSVVRCVLATKSHALTDDERGDPILLAFLDADMSVLGKEPCCYDAYAGCIRREYEFVPREVYCSKRAEILEGFLAGGDIFGTDVMRVALEKRARENLQREVTMLRQGAIPCEPRADKGCQI